MTSRHAPDMSARATLEKQLLTQPKHVVFCRQCVVSNQRPRIVFDGEGVCSACRFAHRKHHVIDWATREAELQQLLDRHRSKDGQWDVLVPCSGGKDASYVAHQLKQRYGMTPLTVTFSPFKYTEIGFQNIQNFIGAGFNNLLFSPNGKVHRKLSRLAFEELGDAWQPFAYGQMAYSFQIALKFGIQLVFYGENGEAEYGGDPKNNDRSHMPLEDWAHLYYKGTTVDDLVAHGIAHTNYFSAADFVPADLNFYRPPTEELFRQSGMQMHWYSYYHKWVPQENYYYSRENTGFEANPGRSEGTYSKYASLDDRMDGFHFFLAFIKFGIGRATSDAAHEVRDGHITREEAVALVRRYDGEFPGRYFQEFLTYLDITEDHFWTVVDRFRPPHLWERSGDEWVLKHRVS